MIQSFFKESAPDEARPLLRLLSESQLNQLHDAALQILERTGLVLHLPEAVALLDSAGAHVEGKDRVRIPSHIVEKALETVPNSIQIWDRNGEPSMCLEGLNSYYGPGPTIQYIYDVYLNRRRATDREDIERAAQLCDYLPNIDFVMTMGMSGGIHPSAKGINPRLTDRYDFAAMLQHTVKPLIFSCWSREGLADIHKIAAVTAGGIDELRRRPFILLFTQPISPLVLDIEPLRQLLYCSEYHIPCIIGSAPLMGGSAPNTIAGSVAQSVAEFLCAMLIGQLKSRGAPIIMGVGYGPMDMRHGTSPYNGPEYYISKTIGKELSRFYGLPDWNYGGVTDAKCLDTQAASEAALSLLNATQIGSNLIHDIGYMEMGMTASWELMVLADEIIGALKHYIRPIRINKDTLALDLINQVGPGGNFLTATHTIEHLKSLWQPLLFDRTSHDEWQAGGALSLEKKLTMKVKWILENHRPQPLAQEVLGELNEIIRHAEQERR